MHKIIISINNKRNSDFIIKLLKQFKFVKVESSDISKNIPEPKKSGDWMDLIGLWKDNDVTIEKIRDKAWPKRV